jgi:hypothetical protein
MAMGQRMKIKQDPKFQPITIVLETSEEAMALWRALMLSEGLHDNELEWQTVRELSNWFSNNAQVGGST